MKVSLAQHKTQHIWPSPKENEDEEPSERYEDLTIKGFQRFGFSLGDGLNTQEYSQKVRRKKISLGDYDNENMNLCLCRCCVNDNHHHLYHYGDDEDCV